MTSKAEVLEQARQVFASYDFQSRDDAGKLLAYNHVLHHPILATVGISAGEIAQLYLNQIIRTSNVLNSFGRDPVYVIMSKLTPRDIMSLCQINKGFVRITSDQTFFKPLLRLHFPEAFETNNPKCQYIALLTHRETHYMVSRKGDMTDDDFWENIQFEDPRKIGPTTYPWLAEPGWLANKAYLRSRSFWRYLMRPGYIPEKFKLFLETFREQLYRTKQREMLEDPNYLADTTAMSFRTLDMQGQAFSYLTLNDGQWVLTQKDLENLADAGKLKIERIDRKVYEIDGVPVDIDPNMDSVFILAGNPLPRGTVAWASILLGNADGVPSIVKIYKSKEDLASEFVKGEYAGIVKGILRLEFLDTVDEYQHPIFETISDEQLVILEVFNKYLAKRGILHPFTKNNLYTYCLENDHFEVFPESDRNSWIFRELQF
jgi:hypothetical protein